MVDKPIAAGTRPTARFCFRTPCAATGETLDPTSLEQRVRITLARLTALNDLQPIPHARLLAALPELTGAQVAAALRRLSEANLVLLQPEGWMMRAPMPIMTSSRSRLLWH